MLPGCSTFKARMNIAIWLPAQLLLFSVGFPDESSLVTEALATGPPGALNTLERL